MKEKNASIKINLILMFVVLMFITVGIISYLVFSKWLSSANDIFIETAENTNQDIVTEVDEFMHLPLHINELNHSLIEYNIIDFTNSSARDAFFVNILKSHSSDVYSFSYGMENGDYYGARRADNGTIQIMHRNAETNNNSWYYSITSDLTAANLMVMAGQFDPRTRTWYKTAKENKTAIFSNIYRHFVLDDLTISAAYPIYNKDDVLLGVMGTHLTLTQINDFLEENVSLKKSSALIVEKNTGLLVANSFKQDNFKTLDDGKIERTNIKEINNSTMFKAYEDYLRTGQTSYQLYNDRDKVMVNITDYQQPGLDWLVITAIPESTFTSGIINNIQLTFGLTLLALLFSGLVFYALINSAFKPVNNLIKTTEYFSNGNLSIRADIVRNDEIGRISKAFNAMANTIDSLVNQLESKVEERTEELEKTNAELEFLSYHDKLTGLYNRMYFEEMLKSLDKEENLPISIIFGDVNGLKLTNDIFGHTVGDALLIKIAEIMNNVFRKNDIIARIGGDEFVILLKKTTKDEATYFMEQVKNDFSNEIIVALKGSISMGCATKKLHKHNIIEIFKTAEDDMYHEKTVNRKAINSGLIESIIATLHERSYWEKEHSYSVSMLCRGIGQMMNLSQANIKRLEDAGFLHDIGKVTFNDAILNQDRVLFEDEEELIQKHTVIGYRLLNMFDETLDLAAPVFAHHERWDGLGYPKGLKGEEIPLLARIIAVAEAYDIMINPTSGIEKTPSQAIKEMKKLSGIKFDPKVVNALIQYIKLPKT